MHAVPRALREAAYGIGAKRRTVADRGSSSRRPSPGSWPALILGVLPRDRRDDGRGDRGGRDRSGVRDASTRSTPGQTMTGAIAVARDRLRPASRPPGTARREHLHGPVLRRPPPVRHHASCLNVMSERFVRRMRRRVLMSTLASPADGRRARASNARAARADGRTSARAVVRARLMLLGAPAVISSSCWSLLVTTSAERRLAGALQARGAGLPDERHVADRSRRAGVLARVSSAR